MPITYRKEKGFPLTSQEMDENFHNLNKRLMFLENQKKTTGNTNDGAGDQTPSFVAQNTKDLGILGPSWKLQGKWKSGVSYDAFDCAFYCFSLYRCTEPHTSDTSFSSCFWEELASFGELFESIKKEMHPPTTNQPLIKFLHTKHCPDGQEKRGCLALIDEKELCYWNGKSWVTLLICSMQPTAQEGLTQPTVQPGVRITY